MKIFLQKALSVAGYEIRRINSRKSPIEATHEEKEIINYIYDEKITMLSVERLYAALSSVKYVIDNDIDGDIVECGVWKGGCSLAMAMLLKKYNSPKKIHLFDTFAGMTAPSELDLETGTGKKLDSEFLSLQEDGYNKMSFSPIEEVKQNFAKANCLHKAVFRKGDVLKTLNLASNLPKKISILRLDTDFYESTLKELENLYPLIAINGVLLVDDYGHYDGARKAVDDYFSNINTPSPMKWVNDYTGRGFIKISN